MQRLAETYARVRRDPLLMIQLLLMVLLAFCIFQGYSDAGPMTVVGCLLLIVWHIRPKWFEGVTRGFGRLARKRFLPIALVGLLSFGVAVGLSLSRGMPQPAVNDEFSYLLAADTFLHGRLANPTHPMWLHFETIHVIFQPTYVSKYPPAQGLALAAGRLIGGKAITGVWLSTASACALLCWSSMAWVGRRWGLLAGLIVAVHPMVLQWSQNYWGGAVAMAGGALLIGAFRRLARRPSVSDSSLLGVGIVILAFSRPYEGAVLTVLVLASLALLTFRSRRIPLSRLFTSVALPLLVTGGLAVSGWLYFNLRVTGNPLQMPAMLHEKTYAVAPLFLWQRPNTEPVYRHEEMRNYQIGWALPYFLSQRQSLDGFVSEAAHKLARYSEAAFQGYAPVVLLALCWVWRDRYLAFGLTILILFTIALLGSTWAIPHYAAPAAGLVIALLLKTLKHLNQYIRSSIKVGQTATRVCVTLLVASMLTTDAGLLHAHPKSWEYDRSRLLSHLQLEPGKHLVLVRYLHNDGHKEWVYNEADIDAAKVVWAHDMGLEQNVELLEYFKERKVWLLIADALAPELSPYDLEAASYATSR